VEDATPRLGFFKQYQTTANTLKNSIFILIVFAWQVAGAPAPDIF